MWMPGPGVQKGLETGDKERVPPGLADLITEEVRAQAAVFKADLTAPAGRFDLPDQACFQPLQLDLRWLTLVQVKGIDTDQFDTPARLQGHCFKRPVGSTGRKGEFG